MIDSKKFGTVDDYFSALDGKTRKKMDHIRKIIRKVSPEAVELIGYGMPAFKLAGRNLIYYAAAKVHIGLYPGPEAIIAFADQLTDYHTSKGAIQLAEDQAVPVKLLEDIIKFKIEENRQLAEVHAAKKKKRKPAVREK